MGYRAVLSALLFISAVPCLHSSVSLTLNSIPKATTETKITKVQKHQAAFFKCVWNAAETVDISWYKNKNILMKSSNIRETPVDDGRALEIRNVTIASEGPYKCCLTRTAVCSNEISLQVIDQPKLISSWGDTMEYSVHPGTHNFELSVKVVYESSGHCYWEKNGKIIQDEEVVNCEINGQRTLTLKFSGLQYKDSGVYKLTFKTSTAHQTLSESVELVVAGPPATPSMPSVLIADPTSVSVNLNANDSAVGDGLPDRYLLQYALVGSGEWMEVSVTAVTAGDAVNVSGLRPCSEYKWRVVAYNERGASEPSSSVTVKMPALHYDRVPFYHDLSRDMVLVYHKNHFVPACLPHHLASTAFGRYICRSASNPIPTEQNTSISNSSVVMFFRQSCDEGDQGCTSICPVTVAKCSKNDMTVSRRLICSHDETTVSSGLSGLPTANGKSHDGNDTILVVVIVVVVCIAVVVAVVLSILWFKCRRNGRNLALFCGYNSVPSPTVDDMPKNSSKSSTSVKQDDEETCSLKDKPVVVSMKPSSGNGSSSVDSKRALEDSHSLVVCDDNSSVNEHTLSRNRRRCHSMSSTLESLTAKTSDTQSSMLGSLAERHLPDRAELSPDTCIVTVDQPDGRQTPAPLPTSTEQAEVVDNQLNTHSRYKTRDIDRPVRTLHPYHKPERSEHSRLPGLTHMLPRSLSAGDAAGWESHPQNIGPKIDGLFQHVDLLRGVLNEVSIQAVENGLTLKRTEDEQKKNSRAIRNIDICTEQMYNVVTDNHDTNVNRNSDSD